MEFEYKVTVIIPVYNAEKNIDRTMSSLFQQTIAQSSVEKDDCAGSGGDHFNR